MNIITRFAPSPTGYLHIGSARTALFNYLFAKHFKNGKFLLRIEDTDRERSTDSAIDAIFSGLKWLGIEWDDEVVYQFSRAERHKEVAYELLARGKAYKCYLTKEELESLRKEARELGKPIRSPWRDNCDSLKAPEGVKPVIRLKVPRDGVCAVHDLVQGDVVTKCEIMDDLILLRSDDTPTYMLAVVVDDHDSSVTHVIRGDDHLNNTPKQIMIYEAMEWQLPKFAHIPLIHGEDGAKLSKRHGALGVDAYKDMGYLSEAVNNFLVRLGWSHGDDEIISKEKAIEWFNLDSVGKSPSRIDFKRLDSINSYYIKQKNDEFLLEYIFSRVDINDQSKSNVKLAMHLIKERVKTLPELMNLSALFYENFYFEIDKELSQKIVAKKELYKQALQMLDSNEKWDRDSLMDLCKNFASLHGEKLGEIAGLLRIALTGKESSPSIFDIMEIIQKDETMRRLRLAE